MPLYWLMYCIVSLFTCSCTVTALLTLYCLFKRTRKLFSSVSTGPWSQTHGSASSWRWSPTSQPLFSASVAGAGDTGCSSKSLQGPPTSAVGAGTRPQVEALSRVWRRSWRGSLLLYPHTRPETSPLHPPNPTAWSSCTSTAAWTWKTKWLCWPSCRRTTEWSTGACRSWPWSCRTLSSGTWPPFYRSKTGCATAWLLDINSCWAT